MLNSICNRPSLFLANFFPGPNPMESAQSFYWRKQTSQILSFFKLLGIDGSEPCRSLALITTLLSFYDNFIIVYHWFLESCNQSWHRIYFQITLYAYDYLPDFNLESFFLFDVNAFFICITKHIALKFMQSFMLLHYIYTITITIF